MNIGNVGRKIFGQKMNWSLHQMGQALLEIRKSGNIGLRLSEHHKILVKICSKYPFFKKSLLNLVVKLNDKFTKYY